MHQKALVFGDQATASQVLKIHKPVTQKAMGKNFYRMDQTAWHDRRVELMRIGLKAKFSQNQALSEFLVGTGKTNILECNTLDTFWGIGMSLNNPKIWIRNSWVQKAENKLGSLLMELRIELKR